MNKRIWFVVFFLMVFMLILTPMALADDHDEEDDDDLYVFGVEAEKLLSLISGGIAIVLSILTLSAWRRTRNKRFLFVTVAFFLFAVKGFIIGSEIFFGELEEWIEPVAILFDFGVLATFFAGIIKK